VTRPSLGPSTRARQSSLHTAGAILGGEAFAKASRLGNPAQVGETSTGATRMDGARLATSQRFRKEESLARKKRMEVEASLPARIGRARVWLPARRIVVAEVGRRHLTPNKLGKRAPKRAAESSEQGSSSSRGSAGETAGWCVGRNDDSHVDLTARNGRGSAQGSGWREIVIQWSQHRASGAAVTGPGL
jgi:hypothetical protein